MFKVMLNMTIVRCYSIIYEGSPPARKNVFFRALPELPLPNVVVGCGGGGGGGDVVVVVYCFVFDT